MAEFGGMFCYVAIAFMVNFAYRYRTLAQENTEATSTIQFTTSSSRSVEILSSVSPTKTTTSKNSSVEQIDLSDLQCPDGVPCSVLGGSCIQCDFKRINYSCIYGEDVEVQCKPISSTIKCTVSMHAVVYKVTGILKFNTKAIRLNITLKSFLAIAIEPAIISHRISKIISLGWNQKSLFLGFNLEI